MNSVIAYYLAARNRAVVGSSCWHSANDEYQWWLSMAARFKAG